MNETINNYCTIVSKEYLIKSLALYDSICKHSRNGFHLWICAMDNASYDVMRKINLANTTIIDIASVENNFLLNAKNNRSITEYCWTVKASFIKFIIKRNRGIDSIIYTDADTYLFSEPSMLFQQLVKNDALLTCHNFSDKFLHLNKQKGKYNAGIIGFKNSIRALNILNWWETKCVEWCYDQVIPNRFADQKYLEMIPRKYARIFIAKPLIANAAMWNIENRKLELKGEKVYLDDDILIFFHFSSFFIIGESELDLWKWDYPKLNEEIREIIYRPYIRSILKGMSLIKRQGEELSKFLPESYNVNSASNYMKIEGSKSTLI